MKYIRLTTIILALLIFTVSCQEDSPNEPNSNGPSNSSGQPMPKITESSDINGILATIYYDFDAGLPGVPAIGLAMGYAQFGTMVDGGTVAINNTELDKNTQGGSVFYIKPGPGSTAQLNDVSFNGSLHKWNVSGSGNILEFEGDVKSPSKFNVTAPKNNTTISKSNDLNITWVRTGLSDEKILINLISLNDSKSIVTEQDLTNNGSYKIASSKLSSLSGKVMVQIVKYRYKEISANDKTYLIISEVVKSLTLTIQ
ncbi:MAG: hypothetical protein V3V16_15260 [Melioribacteraceae bacterium]